MVQSPPLLHAHQTRHQPPATTVKLSLLRLTTKQSPPRHHHPLRHHLLPLEHGTSLFLWRLSQGRQGWLLLAPALSPAPTSPACPPPPSEHLQVGCPTPGPCQMPDLVRQKRSSSSTVIRHGIGINRSSGQPEDPISTMAESVPGLPLGFPSMVADLNLL